MLKNSDLCKNKVCVVTGGAKGIGNKIALKLAEDGAVVYVCDLKEFEIENDNIHSLVLNVCDTEAVKTTLQQIYKKEGHIDCLINNAGVIINKNMSMMSSNDIDVMYRVNVNAVFGLINYASRLMARNGGGSIVNIASITAVLGSPGQVAYSATKGAIISMTKSAAKELAPMGVRVNAVAPGIIKTERFAEIYETTNSQKIEERISHIVLGRLGTPEDVANACSFFALDRSQGISGQILCVDGCSSI